MQNEQERTQSWKRSAHKKHIQLLERYPALSFITAKSILRDVTYDMEKALEVVTSLSHRLRFLLDQRPRSQELLPDEKPYIDTASAGIQQFDVGDINANTRKRSSKGSKKNRRAVESKCKAAVRAALMEKEENAKAEKEALIRERAQRKARARMERKRKRKEEEEELVKRRQSLRDFNDRRQKLEAFFVKQQKRAQRAADAEEAKLYSQKKRKSSKKKKLIVKTSCRVSRAHFSGVLRTKKRFMLCAKETRRMSLPQEKRSKRRKVKTRTSVVTATVCSDCLKTDCDGNCKGFNTLDVKPLSCAPCDLSKAVSDCHPCSCGCVTFDEAKMMCSECVSCSDAGAVLVDEEVDVPSCAGCSWNHIQLFYEPKNVYLQNCCLGWSIRQLKQVIWHKTREPPPDLIMNGKPLRDDLWLYMYCCSDSSLFALPTNGKGGTKPPPPPYHPGHPSGYHYPPYPPPPRYHHQSYNARNDYNVRDSEGERRVPASEGTGERASMPFYSEPYNMNHSHNILAEIEQLRRDLRLAFQERDEAVEQQNMATESCRQWAEYGKKRDECIKELERENRNLREAVASLQTDMDKLNDDFQKASSGTSIVSPDTVDSGGPSFWNDKRSSELSEGWLKERGLYKTLDELVFADESEIGNKSGRARKALNVIYTLLDGNARALRYLFDAVIKRNKYLLDPYIAKHASQQASVGNNRDCDTQAAVDIVASIRSLFAIYKMSGSDSVRHLFLSIIAASKFSGEVTDAAVKRLFGVGPDRMISGNTFCKTIAELDGKPFDFPKRKPRKDEIWPLVKAFVEEHVCHSDEYTRVDTNRSTKEVPVVEYRRLEGGGFQEIPGKKKEAHQKRVWVDVTSVGELYKIVSESDTYKALDFTFGETLFRQAICPCVGFPESRSSVNLHITGVDEAMKALKKHSTKIRDLRLSCTDSECNTCTKYKAAYKAAHCFDPTCELCPDYQQSVPFAKKDAIHPSCTICKTYRETEVAKHPFPVTFESMLKKHPQDFLREAMCEQKEYPDLKFNDEAEAPKLLGWDCGKGTCKDCGFTKKLGLLGCKTLTESALPFQMLVWGEGGRTSSNDEARTQKELITYNTTLGGGLAKFDEICKEARAHMTRDQRSKRRERNIRTRFRKDEIVAYTDFSATPDLEALLKDNCAEANHCLIDVFVILSNPREVSYTTDEGNVATKRINDCTYVGIWGPTDGYGKKNDHVCHHAAFDNVVTSFKEKLLQELGIDLAKVWLFTDNCSSQYKCQYTMMVTAMFAEKYPGVVLEHTYAMKYEFKGVWDAFGGLLKRHIVKGEGKGVRMSLSKDAFCYSYRKLHGKRETYDVDDNMYDSKMLLSKGPQTMTDCWIWYITNSKADFEKMKADHANSEARIVFCDREKSPPTVGDKKSKGVKKVQYIRGFKDFTKRGDGKGEFKLEVAEDSCCCPRCMVDETRDRCTQKRIRNVKKIEGIVDMSDALSLKMKRFIKKRLQCADKDFTIKRLEEEAVKHGVELDPNRQKNRVLPLLFPLCRHFLKERTGGSQEEELLREVESATSCEPSAASCEPTRIRRQQRSKRHSRNDTDSESEEDTSTMEPSAQLEAHQRPTRASSRLRKPTTRAAESCKQQEDFESSDDDSDSSSAADDDEDDFRLGDNPVLWSLESEMVGGDDELQSAVRPSEGNAGVDTSDDELRRMSLPNIGYRSLQKICKKRGIKANQSHEAMIGALYAYLETASPEPEVESDDEIEESV